MSLRAAVDALHGKSFLSIEEMIEIAALPAEAIATVPRQNSGGGWHCVVAYPEKRHYVSDPDFSTSGYGATPAEAARNLADGVIRDLQGHGNRYAPHWDHYDILYRLLPHWRARA